MKVFVDADLCMGCGVCESIAPEIFLIGEDGIAKVMVDLVSPEMEDLVKQAVEECPEEAISIKE
jgi:ferredoxin